MKKLLIALLLTMVLVSGCSKNEGPAATKVDLTEVVEKLTKDVEVPMYETVPLDEETFAYFTNMEYDKDLEAVEADGLVNISAHSVVLIYSADKAEAVAQELAQKADPRKWVCVAAENAQVAYSDHYVLLVMSFEDVVSGMFSNFDSFVKEINDGTVKTLDVAN